MSVSLKKRENVDLSKPELPRKLPEITPVHLIDEEETIVKRPSTVVRSDVLPNSDKSHLDEIAPDSISKDMEIHHHNRKGIVIGLVLFLVVVLAALLVLLNLPDNFSQELSKAFQEFSSIFDETLVNLSSNSLITFLLGVSFFLAGVFLILKLFKIFRE